ncbi:hypothetical protein QLX08_002375, partial [Tetragonisca angustula]
DKWHYVHLK